MMYAIRTRLAVRIYGMVTDSVSVRGICGHEKRSKLMSSAPELHPESTGWPGTVSVSLYRKAVDKERMQVNVSHHYQISIQNLQDWNGHLSIYRESVGKETQQINNRHQG